VFPAGRCEAERIKDGDFAMLSWGEEMWVSKSRLSVLLVLTTVFLSTQCAALCAFEPCSAGETVSTPNVDLPCHHHEVPSQPSAPCAHHIVVQADVAQPVIAPAVCGNVLAMDVPALLTVTGPSLSGVDILVHHSSSPPDLAVLSSVVLRI
jgi:hypothetical protein